MSVKKNILANYVSQMYMSLTGILVLPLYLKYMGAEAYGLVGFFTVLQTWFGLLDMGLTPTIARETARLKAGAITEFYYRTLLRALQMLFITIAILGAVSLALCADYLAHYWFKVKYLSIQETKTALQIMGIGVALRWLSSLYRSVLIGSEQFVSLSIYTMSFTTFRYFGVIPVLKYIGSTPKIFFIYQAIISILELLVLSKKAFSTVARSTDIKAIPYSPLKLFKSMQPIFCFATSIALTTAIWILITQSDKIILSRLIPLSEYGYFTLAVLAASGVSLLSIPVSNVLLPQLTKLKAENNEISFLNLYHKGTQFIAMIVVPIILILVFFPEQILWAWTNDHKTSEIGAPILRLYALGNGILTLSAFPYYLQYAYGNLRLHVIGNIFFLIILIPAIILATSNYGMIGAGWVWMLANLGFFTIWTAIVHGYFIKNLHFNWLFKDILPSVLISIVSLFMLKEYLNDTNEIHILLCKFVGYICLTYSINLLYLKLRTFSTSFKPNFNLSIEEQ